MTAAFSLCRAHNCVICSNITALWMKCNCAITVILGKCHKRRMPVNQQDILYQSVGNKALPYSFSLKRCYSCLIRAEHFIRSFSSVAWVFVMTFYCFLLIIKSCFPRLYCKALCTALWKSATQIKSIVVSYFAQKAHLSFHGELVVIIMI